MMDVEYVTEILRAAERANVADRRAWDNLTHPDRLAGYGREVDEAERVYFTKSRKAPPVPVHIKGDGE